MRSPATPAPAPQLGAAGPAARLLAVCRQYHGQPVGYSKLARLAGLSRETCGDLLNELWWAGQVWYRSATEPLHAPPASAGPWYPARLADQQVPWAVVRHRPADPGHYVLEEVPGLRFATEQAAAEYAARHNPPPDTTPPPAAAAAQINAA